MVACSARPGAHELRKRQTTLKRALTSRLMASGKLQSSTQVCNNDAFTFHGAPDLPLSLGEQWMKCKQLSIWRVMVASRRGYDCPMIILWNWIPSSHEHKPRIRPGNVARATGSPPQGQWSPQDLNRSSTPAMPQPVSPGRWPFLQPHSDAHHIYDYTTCRIMHISILIHYAHGFPTGLEYFWHLLWAVAVSIGTPQHPSS